MSKVKYPTRCQIIDPEGTEITPDLRRATPKVSKPHVGKCGLAERINGVVTITLDDGNIIHGYECWWTPLEV